MRKEVNHDPGSLPSIHNWMTSYIFFKMNALEFALQNIETRRSEARTGHYAAGGIREGGRMANDWRLFAGIDYLLSQREAMLFLRYSNSSFRYNGQEPGFKTTQR
jgi:hypothetical protein